MLVSFVTFVIENQNASQRVHNSTFLKVIIAPKILIDSVGDNPMYKFFFFEIKTAIKCPIDDIRYKFLIVDKYLIIDTDFK